MDYLANINVNQKDDVSRYEPFYKGVSMPELLSCLYRPTKASPPYGRRGNSLGNSWLMGLEFSLMSL